MKVWMVLLLAASYEALAKETDVKCIICRSKLSKKQRKAFVRSDSEMPFCVACNLRSSRVAAKMKRVAHA